jgi:acyl-CoA synthetase (AMP-forming)/AMP-acid ligase II
MWAPRWLPVLASRAYDSIPRNPSGKILKSELREPYWKGLERQVNKGVNVKGKSRRSDREKSRRSDR